MYKDRLRELGLFCLKKLKQGGYFIDVFNQLLVQYKENISLYFGIYPILLEGFTVMVQEITGTG